MMHVMDAGVAGEPPQHRQKIVMAPAHDHLLGQHLRPWDWAQVLKYYA